MALADSVTDLETKRDALVAELLALDLSGPDVSIDGVSINMTQYVASLRQRIEDIQKLIDAFSGPCLVYTQGR